MQDIKKLKLVRISWIDSARYEGWKHCNEVINDGDVLHCDSVGWVLNQNKDMVLLAPTVCEDNGHVMSAFTIPKAAVIKMKELKG